MEVMIIASEASSVQPCGWKEVELQNCAWKSQKNCQKLGRNDGGYSIKKKGGNVVNNNINNNSNSSNNDGKNNTSNHKSNNTKTAV